MATSDHLSEPCGRLEGQVAVVTGAARNIGAAVAARLAAEGADVAVNYQDRSQAGMAANVVSGIIERGGRGQAFEADVGDPEGVTAMFASVAVELGPPRVLVNNAAASVVNDTPWHRITSDDWAHVMRVNVAGAVLCAREAWPTMRDAGGGAIVNLSSIRVLLGMPGNTHYTASKAALLGLSRSLARELGADNIRVNALVVGAIKTPEESFYGSSEEIDRQVLEAQALKRRGVVEDVAAAVAFLCSPDAAFITGQALTVDGGWVMC